MIKRPLSITIISWGFIALGSLAFLASLLPLIDSDAAQRLAGSPSERWLVPIIRMLAVLCGASMLYGFNWARWLLAVWIGYHLVLSALHSPLELMVHGLLFAVILYFVFRPQASAYFRGAS